ncbi:MAG: hypothetical protein JST48_01195 [Bacteroidetes bacterium]|nr:hypothetical protein [Bacteroidota bacterium]
MTEEILKVFQVFFWSAIKFILGPMLGYITHLHFLATFFATVAGMMFSVVAFTYFGDWLRKKLLNRFFKNKEHEEQKHSRLRNFIIKYGLGGVAFLTPLFLTPIGGTILAVSLGKTKNKILFFMLVSATAWSLAFTSVVYWLGPKILKWFDVIKYFFS